MPSRMPSGLFLSDEDAAALDTVVLLGLIELARRPRGIPAGVEKRAMVIHQAALEFQASAQASASVQVNPGSGTSIDAFGSAKPRSFVTNRLTVQEAARLAGVSESYVRRIARRGAVTAARSGSRGEWLVDGGQWAAWAAERNRRKAA